MIFFPLHLPDVEGWLDGSSHEDPLNRLEWKTSNNSREEITAGVSLLFEYMKYNTLEVEGPVSETSEAYGTICQERINTFSRSTIDSYGRIMAPALYVEVKKAWSAMILCIVRTAVSDIINGAKILQ